MPFTAPSCSSLISVLTVSILFLALTTRRALVRWSEYWTVQTRGNKNRVCDQNIRCRYNPTWHLPVCTLPSVKSLLFHQLVSNRRVWFPVPDAVITVWVQIRRRRLALCLSALLIYICAQTTSAMIWLHCHLLFFFKKIKSQHFLLVNRLLHISVLSFNAFSLKRNNSVCNFSSY